MSTQDQAKALAESMGISEHDVMGLARAAARSIAAEVGTKKALSLSSEGQTELALAYAESEIKKFDQFVSAYLTKPEVKKAFQQAVIAA